MDWRWLLLSFEGRINRAKFWLGILVLMAIYLVAYAIIGVAFGGTFTYESTACRNSTARCGR